MTMETPIFNIWPWRNHRYYSCPGWWFQPTPLKNMSSSVGIVKFPMESYKIHAPNHQPVIVVSIE